MFRFLLATIISIALSYGAFAQTISGQQIPLPTSQGGTGGTLGTFMLGGVLHGANMNSTADQAITIVSPFPNYRVASVAVANPSVSMTTVVGGIFSGAGKTGIAVVAAGTTYAGLTTNAANTTGNLVAVSTAATSLNTTTVFLSLTTPQGVAATADFYLYITPLP